MGLDSDLDLDCCSESAKHFVSRGEYVENMKDSFHPGVYTIQGAYNKDRNNQITASNLSTCIVAISADPRMQMSGF